MILGYRCSLCQTEYGLEEITYTCPSDGGNLDVVYDWRAVSRRTSPSKISASAEASIWRYLPLLPVEDPGHAGSTLRAVGWTPLFAPARLRQSLGLPHLWLKDDSRNPTASFKDRASAVVIARAQAIQAETVVTASTGNAGAALAGMAAAVGMAAVILAPRTAPPAKVAQLLIFGARVFLVEGSYDDAFDLTCEAIEAFGWYSRNTGQNPFTAEGKKTAALEIAEQFSLATAASGRGGTGWVVPDAIFVSVGDGNIIAGLHKGFKDLLALGWIERIPRLFGVQSTASAPIYNAFVSGEEKITRVQAATVADSISVGLPRDGIRGLRAATQTGGAYLAVADEAILDAIRVLARWAGVFAEPAGAASYAGLVEALQQGLVSESDRVLVLNTGNGLKDVRSAMQVAGQATVVEPRLEALRHAMG
jgi:threonine synthase